MATYDVEDIGFDHPSLLTAHLEASVVARCRESRDRPWKCQNHCSPLPTAGTTIRDVDFEWQAATEGEAAQITTTHQANRVTEDAAIGACAAVFAALAEGEITEVTEHGTGVDYWVDSAAPFWKSGGFSRATVPRCGSVRQKGDNNCWLAVFAGWAVPATSSSWRSVVIRRFLVITLSH